VGVWGNADSLEGVGKERWRALKNWKVLNPCLAEMPPRASVLLSRDWPSSSSVAAVLLLNDLCRDERLLFLQIHFEPDPAISACVQQLGFLNPMGIGESYCVLNPAQLECWWNILALLP